MTMKDQNWICNEYEEQAKRIEFRRSRTYRLEEFALHP
jgi:hypothetical protein